MVLINKLRLRVNLISFYRCLMGCDTEEGALLLEVHGDGHGRQCTETAFFVRYKEKKIFIKRVLRRWKRAGQRR